MSRARPDGPVRPDDPSSGISVRNAATDVHINTDLVDITVRSRWARQLVKALLSLGPWAVLLTVYGLLVDHLDDGLFSQSWLKFVFSGVLALLVAVGVALGSRRLARVTRFTTAPEPDGDVVRSPQPTIATILAGSRGRLVTELRNRMDSGRVLTGWPQFFGGSESRPTAIGTSYGIRLLNALDVNIPTIDRGRLVETVLESQLPSGGWAASSQRDIPRPEVTAWVLSGTMRGGVPAGRLDPLVQRFMDILGDDTDRTGLTSTSVVTTVVTALAEIAPASDVTRRDLTQRYVDLIVNGALDAPGDPSLAAWGARLSGDSTFSMPHTARAVLALTRFARVCEDEQLAGRLHALALRGARWMCSHDTANSFLTQLHNKEDQIRRPFGAMQADLLVISHFTSAWVARALLALDQDEFVPFIRIAVNSVVHQQKEGVWQWDDTEPVWMTYQGVATLREYSTRCLPWPP